LTSIFVHFTEFDCISSIFYALIARWIDPLFESISVQLQNFTTKHISNLYTYIGNPFDLEINCNRQT